VSDLRCFGDILTGTLGVNKPQVIVAQLGARMHYAVPVLLHQAGMLAHFYTDAYVGRGSSWYLPAQAARLLPEAWRPAPLRRLLDRREDSLPHNKITAFKLFGLRYTQALNGAASIAERENINLEYGEHFCELILRHDIPDGAAIYACQSATLPLFLKIRRMRILEKFIAPKIIEWQLLSSEQSFWPGWEEPYPQRELFQPRMELEQRELELADLVICGSAFVAQGIISLGISPEKIEVVPYGVEGSRFAYNRQPWDGLRPLRLLSVGEVTLRKGVQYLFRALQKLATLRYEARVVGGISIQEPFRSSLRECAELTGLVPRSEVARHFAWADIFVFPSICEGSATVIYEALASGLPVITTPNAGSVVRDGVDGFIVPIRDAEALVEKIESLAKSPELLVWMSQNARDRAQEFSWEAYKERLVKAITNAFNKLSANR
jgi:glycosyltransferase involved in cell wall biosynthesis